MVPLLRFLVDLYVYLPVYYAVLLNSVSAYPPLLLYAVPPLAASLLAVWTLARADSVKTIAAAYGAAIGILVLVLVIMEATYLTPDLGRSTGIDEIISTLSLGTLIASTPFALLWRMLRK